MKKFKRKIKRILTNLSKRNLLIRKLFRKTIYLKRSLSYQKFYKKNKVEDNIIIFESYMGRSYACSPKAIYEEMISNPKYKDFKLIWAFKDVKSYINLPKLKKATLVKHGSKEYYNYYSKAKYWITNSRLPEHIKKKDNQIYVQCWHGTPLKRLALDIIDGAKNALSTKREMIIKNNRDAKRYNYMISPSKFCTDKFITAFNLVRLRKQNIILEKGYPRNDFLYNYKDEDITITKTRLGIPKNKKVILYAPTWRDDQHTTGLGYTYKSKVDFDYLKKHLEKEYIILFRAHYFVANSFDFSKYENFVYDVSKVDDINDLYIISDVLITDYSSVFFDYANLKRPLIFFMYDLEYYEKDLRGFYIDLDELPGDIVKEEKDIVDILKNIEKYNKKHSTKYSKFNKKYNYLDDGKATQRILEEIIK